MKCITMFAGNEAKDFVMQHLNEIGDVVNLQRDAHAAYGDLKWGIEVQDDNETAQTMKLVVF
jgi:hypothetical protein